MTFDDKLDKILLSHGAEQGELHHSLKKAIKDLVLSDVVGEDVDINEIKVGRIKNIKGDRKGADVKAFDWSIEVETWKNQLRAEQRLIINGKESSNE